jgi:site-specific recombinase XerD
MLTIKIKGRPTLGNLQGPFEAAIAHRKTWLHYSYELDKIVAYLGADKSPDDVYRQDVANLRQHLVEHFGYGEDRANRAISVGSSFWTWMMDHAVTTSNPFKKQRVYKNVLPVQLILT